MRPTVLMLLTNAYDPDPRVRQEALALTSFGYHVRILAWDRDLKSPQFECKEGIDVERVFLRSLHGRGNTQLLFYAWLYIKMLWRGWRTPCDVLHCHDLDTLPLGFLLGKVKRKPVVYDAHESFVDMLQGSIHPLLQRGLFALEDSLISRINLLITVGEKLKRFFVERGSARAVVVGNWKRVEEFERTAQQNAEVRQRLNIPADATVVVCIGQLFKDRKIAELLAAVDQCEGVYLIIGGKGQLEPMVESAVARNNRIRYVGFVPGAQIPEYTCAGDIVYYGFDPENPNARFSAPNKLFEALAAGRALVSGNFGEIADVISSGSCGIVLEEYTPAAIASAFARLTDPAVREVFASNAKRLGQTAMNWRKGEETLQREYSTLCPASPKLPDQSWTYEVAGEGTTPKL